MKISKKELIKMDACKSGLKRFIYQTNDTDNSVYVTSLIGGKNTYSDLLWLAGKKLDQSRIVRFACDCALLNIETIKPYTDQYDLIVESLKNPSAADAAINAINAANAAIINAANAYNANTGNVYVAYSAANATINAYNAKTDNDYAASAANAAAYDGGKKMLINDLLVAMFNEIN
ncbi:hypothetical protein S140_229 [Shewanella sp. phage 1/40]|uniref:hypothetical protein n=1 Tax=Shewanella sp. phage 1/40 TaxID=1458860 RepID=UPI0004F5EA8D|nr:hypothetical protein S140_229 [Shewanella sp. phage 1/40]AHK11636.1 hypothetical protein S140_229 [Shewanella sp. phage 1/40]